MLSGPEVFTPIFLQFLPKTRLAKYHHSSFPITHKDGKIGIFVQIVMEINWKQQRTESISMQLSIYQGVLNLY